MVYGIDGKDKSRKQVLATNDYTLAGLVLHTYNNTKITANSADPVLLPSFGNGVAERLHELATIIGKNGAGVKINKKGLYAIMLRCSVEANGSQIEIAPYDYDDGSRLACHARTFNVTGEEVIMLPFIMSLKAGEKIQFKAWRKNTKGFTCKVLDCMMYALDWEGKVEK